MVASTGTVCIVSKRHFSSYSTVLRLAAVICLGLVATVRGWSDETNRPPALMSPGSPGNGAVDVANPAPLTVLASDPEGKELTITFSGREMSSAPDFTIIAVPDTQYYVSSLHGGQPEMFTKQVEWILANLTNRNIVYVAQLGDCVQNGDNGGTNAEWLLATNALYRLEDPIRTMMPAGLPYGVAVGNHDQNLGTGTTTFYNQYFGKQHFAGRPYYGGHYGTNNDVHYDLFNASGLDFIAIYFEFDAGVTNTAAIDWADGILKKYPQRRAIIVSHWIINDGFNATFSKQGRAIYDKLKANPNLFLMLSGHVTPEEGQRKDTFEGRTVWSLMSDYQGRTNGGNGWLRIYTFSPSENMIHARTYSPWLDRFETDASSQFDIPYEMTQTNAFKGLATLKRVSGAGASFPWSNLTPGGNYEWFATISDGTNWITSPVSHFRTVNPATPAR
jgi:hypothetical protein